MHFTTPLFTSSPLPGRPSPGSRLTSCVIPSFLYQVLDYKPVSHQLRTFCLTLGTDLPWADYLYPGNLRLSANGFFIRFFVTHAGIFTCITSTILHNIASSAYTTLSYHSHVLNFTNRFFIYKYILNIIPFISIYVFIAILKVEYMEIRSFGSMLSPVKLSAQND